MGLSGLYGSFGNIAGFGYSQPLGGTTAVGSNYDFGDGTKTIKPGRVNPADCQTCKERKYKDGSDESDVSFQTAQHVSPESAGARVRGHEQEHVANAYEKAEKAGGKVLQASVSIHTAVCPECGRVYVSGGVTTTKIAYPTGTEDNPYQKQRKAQLDDAVKGANVDLSA